MKTVAVILAASEERSMGHPTALMEHEPGGGKTFLQSLASTFSKAGCSVLGVVGDAAEEVKEQHPTLELVESSSWRERAGAPLRAGLQAALEEGAEVVLVHPVDMPAVRASTIKSLVNKLEDGEALRPVFESAPGFPVVLGRQAVERLLQADESKAAETLLASMPVRNLPVKDPGVVVRIRGADLYERLFGSAPKLAPPPKRRMRRTPMSEPELEAEQQAAGGEN
ncbi:MAG: NTP transferase domain-containing protein [Myxococcaceae bacterium]|nr:NTP transferase domain-containing protein [Myxococcaceae bacterium]MCI0672328.1 NTP transferase domain-containing protein [Myxococcaceae bacterium]